MISKQEFEARKALKLEKLRREVRNGLDQFDCGKVVDGKTLFAEWDQERQD